MCSHSNACSKKRTYGPSPAASKMSISGRLLVGEVEIASGQAAEGRARLEALERQARAKGFLLIANQAATARR